MKSRVALIQCRDYGIEGITEAVETGINLLGGISAFARKDETILLKPNLLAGDPPEKAVTTHPSVFGAVARLLQQKKIGIGYGDSPGLGNPLKIARRTGIKDMADLLEIPFLDFQKGRQVSLPEAMLARQMVIANGALDADGIISISKMKTHALTLITGAVKNTFGCVPGFHKEEFHLKMKDIRIFSAMLVDLNKFLKPRLYIMDGVMAMEGNGPRSGDPKQMNVLLFSTDPVALDSVFCRLVNLKPEFVPTLKIGYQAGLGTYNEEEIDLLGDDFKKLIRPEFRVVRRPIRELALLQNLPAFLKNLLLSRPVIDAGKCTGCGSCILQCPVPEKAVNWPTGNKRGRPQYDYRLCIRCYCCQEICPEKAISVMTPSLGRMIFR
jgi:uncharacterized protein (DUF362 family)/Pyruvate/2-oxoacid:ferredoxin oxidoreductase delta subunit